MDRQPAAPDVRNSRSRSRSRSLPPKTSRDEHTPNEFWRCAPTKGEQLAGEVGLISLRARGVNVTLQELQAQIHPARKDALSKLLVKCNIRDDELDQPLTLCALACFSGPETISAPYLLHAVMLAAHEREIPLTRDRELESLLCLMDLHCQGVEVNLFDLATFADDKMVLPFLSLVEKVGNAYDIDGDRMRYISSVRVGKLAAETGPETMPASQLWELVESVRLKEAHFPRSLPKREVKTINGRKYTVCDDVYYDASLYETDTTNVPHLTECDGIHIRRRDPMLHSFGRLVKLLANQYTHESKARMRQSNLDFQAAIRAMRRAVRL